MKISIFSLLPLGLCGLVTSCYPPYPPVDPNRPVTPPAPVNETTLNDEGQRQLEEARRRLEAEQRNQQGLGQLPSTDIPTSPTTGPSIPTAPGTYRYAEKVAGKPGYVFNPFTKNQVDVRNIPSGTLVRDPHDPDPTHKFRVP